MSKVKSTFEYHKDQSGLSPFQVYLKYTNEKDITSSKVAELLSANISKEDLTILDIGTGNGEFIEMILKKISKPYTSISIDLLEPSEDLIEELKSRSAKFDSKVKCNIIHNNWEEFDSAQKYDFILASHLYHFPKDKYYEDLSRMVSFLNKEGKLVFVLREADDPYEFKMKFKPILNNVKDYKARVIDEALEIFEKISSEKSTLKIKHFTASNTLEIPYKTNPDDTISIVEFYLNHTWNQISEVLRTQIMEFINGKKGKFEQRDGILLISKKND